jgi:uncharacterized protein GlcG (DUF336 family)
MSSEKEQFDVSSLSRCSYTSGLTLQTARKMLEAGMKEAERLGVSMAIAIADAGGNLLAFYRMENAPLLSIQIAMDKAFTAVFGKMPTLFWKGEYTSGEIVPLFFHERWITFQGGFPLVTGDKIFGGIGASGGRIEDVYVTRAALKAGGFSTKDADNIISGSETADKK